MELDSELREKAEALFDRMHLALGDEVRVLHALKAVCQASRTGAPEKDLKVSQASGRLLEVGFERVGRVLVLLVPAAEFEHLVAKEGACVEARKEVVAGCVVKRSFAPEKAALKIGGGDRNVFGRFRREFFFCSDGRAHGEAELPEGGEEGRDFCFRLLVFSPVV